MQLLRAGEISVGIYIPADFDRRVTDRERVAVHLLVDGSDPTIGGIVDGLKQMPLAFDTTVQPKRKRRKSKYAPITTRNEAHR